MKHKSQKKTKNQIDGAVSEDEAEGRVALSGPDSEDIVRLKPIMGIKPGVYLAALSVLILLVLFFLGFMLHGIVDQGSKYRFVSSPEGVAVRVDDVYMGATPCTVFLRKGERQVDFVLPAFNKVRVSLNVKTNIFAHTFLSRGILGEADLTELGPLSALEYGAQEAAKWSFAGEPTNTYQVPLSLSQGALRTKIDPKNTAMRERANGILKVAARFTNSRTALKDLIRAKFIVDNYGNGLSPLSAVGTIKEITAFMAHNQDFTMQVCDLMGENADFILKSDWYKSHIIDAIFNNQSRNISRAQFGGVINVAGLNFVQIKDGTYESTPDIKYMTTVSSYYLAENEVTELQWSAFIRENPEWAKENAEKLINEGKVSSDYMIKIDDPSYPAGTASGVSWYAAAAYCKWLTTKLPTSLAAWEVRLPTEIEWEYAAHGVEGAGGKGLLKKMFNTNIPSASSASNAGMWEWCQEPFSPIYFINESYSALEAGEDRTASLSELVSSPQRSVRGGSWINPPGTVNIETRAGLAPTSCSVFVSFRPAICKID
ncbi:MAG: hypothetical protein Ta2B_01700 [Termitinemataceae bacterium]|nr:MAG: hypothetical protein Ta2B_01700 [Termitinemataceae bacterium]